MPPPFRPQRTLPKRQSKTTNKQINNEKEDKHSKVTTATTKRPASLSPEGLHKKRSAFGDITNALEKVIVDSKKALKLPRKKTVKHKVIVSKPVIKTENVPIDLTTSTLTESCSSPDDEIVFNSLSIEVRTKDVNSIISPVETSSSETSIDFPSSGKKKFDDFDASLNGDPLQVPQYAAFIFKYYKERERKFVIGKYMERQSEITRCMRSILVDWMVEVQESFELNHETLYLAVKLVDRFLDRVDVPKEILQLVGTTALFIAAKYDERIPPSVEDFLYICDDAYNKGSLLELERDILQALNFELGVPLSYCFLRRFARCSKTSMETLTLARYILELSLMDYDFLGILDSHMAAAALLLAFKMKKENGWTQTLQHYTGFIESDLRNVVRRFNLMLLTPTNKSLMSVRTKYSHPVFFKASKIQALQVTDPFLQP